MLFAAREKQMIVAKKGIIREIPGFFAMRSEKALKL